MNKIGSETLKLNSVEIHEDNEFNPRSVVVYFNGCNLNCKYCFNSELIPDTNVSVNVGTVYNLIQVAAVRKGTNSVVITGGEPTKQAEPLKRLITDLKQGGYFVDLTTNLLFNEEEKKLCEIIRKVDTLKVNIKDPNVKGYNLDTVLNNLKTLMLDESGTESGTKSGTKIEVTYTYGVDSWELVKMLDVVRYLDVLYSQYTHFSQGVILQIDPLDEKRHKCVADLDLLEKFSEKYNLKIYRK